MGFRPVFKCVCITVLLACPQVFPEDGENAGPYYPYIRAHPNYFLTRFEYGDAAVVSVAQAFEVQRYFIGGLLEVRNEPRFNEKTFPNHNWRGFAQAAFASGVLDEAPFQLLFISGLEHESAHATMGIVEPTKDAYQMIYDKTYRTMAMNAVFISPFIRWQQSFICLELKPALMFYFYSKNTPELPGGGLAESPGQSLGGELSVPLPGPLRLYASGFERTVFRSSSRKTGDIYMKSDTGAVLVRREYNIIQDLYTLQLKAGLLWKLKWWGQCLNLYMNYLNGNIFGYVDSRDKRSVISAGAGLEKKF